MKHLEDTALQHRSLVGFWIYIMSDCLLFASLFATYGVLRLNTAGGAGAGEIFDLTYVLAETLILLTSSFTMGLAMIALYRNNRTHVLAWLIVTLALGICFIALELNEFRELITEGHTYQASAFLSSFFTLVGTHGLHVLIGLLWILFMVGRLLKGTMSAMTQRRIMCLALFWHFLDIVWIFIFSFAYILPTIL